MAREYAELEYPKGDGSYDFTFNPVGTSLVGLSVGTTSGFAWDLRRIREELAARGLDWDLPPYPAADESAVRQVTEVAVVSAESDPQP